MGKILQTKKLTTGFEAIILTLGLFIIGGLLWHFAPGLKVSESKQLQSLVIDSTGVNNTTTSAMIELPTKTISNMVQSKPKSRIAGYAWNGQTPMYLALGGSFTTKGSLMEKYGINLELVRQDWLSEISAMQMKFVEEYDSGKEFPDSDKSAFGIMIMGDGAPFYISTRQKSLDEKFGKDKYHLEVVGAIGMSNGEDKVIGPPEWKANPKTMLGSLISTVPGDGDWVTLLNFCFANGLKVNPDFNTYDPNAVNIYPSADDDYMNSARELIASQTQGFTVELKEVSNGKLTGKTIKKEIDGCATWTPGDKTVFDALTGYTDIASTADFKNQMATTLIVVKEWAEKHPQIVTDILSASLEAANQMKQYDAWRVRGSEAVASGFKLETPKYWYDMFQGQTGEKSGIKYNMGGTRVMNYADNLQYYGVVDGNNRYRSVYEQVSNYLTELNPFGFNEAVDGIVPYDKAVNLSYLKNVKVMDAGIVDPVNYVDNRTEVMASGEWHINFNTGSDVIQKSSDKDLETIYNLLTQAEQTKVILIGHTDNTGNSQINDKLSNDRAKSVSKYLISKGILKERIQEVGGKGSSDPVASNDTPDGRAQNRRVQVTLLK